MPRHDDRVRDLHTDFRTSYIDMLETRDAQVRVEKAAEIDRIQRELTKLLDGE